MGGKWRSSGGRWRNLGSRETPLSGGQRTLVDSGGMLSNRIHTHEVAVQVLHRPPQRGWVVEPLLQLILHQLALFAFAASLESIFVPDARLRINPIVFHVVP